MDRVINDDPNVDRTREYVARDDWSVARADVIGRLEASRGRIRIGRILGLFAEIEREQREQ